MRGALLPTAMSHLASFTAKTGRSSKTQSTSVHAGCFRSSAIIIYVSSSSLFIVPCIVPLRSTVDFVRGFPPPS